MLPYSLINKLACDASFFFEEELTLVDLLGYGWLLSSVVGGHNTNARIKTPTFDLFRQIIVLVSLHVLLDTLTATFCFMYVL